MPFFKLNDVFAGRYVLVELIGEGDSSEVWKAKNQLADELVVVLKIYTPEKGLDDMEVRQFGQQFSHLQHLYHPHLLKAYHFDIWEGSPYLIMPFCPGGSLSRLLREDSSFSEKQVALVMDQVGSALALLHQQEPPILHQDVKPENIVISQADYFLLADYEISSRSRHPLPESAPVSRPAVEAYAPPESFDRYQKADPSGDIFSLGVTLYEMCTKTIPWEGAGSQSLLTGKSVPDLPGKYSTELNALLKSCMSVYRRERPSAEEIHLRGKNFLETGSWDLPDKENAAGKPTRRLAPYLLSAAVFALLLTAAYWAYFNDLIPVPKENLQQNATPVDQHQNQDVNEMLIVMLEEELEEKTRRALELEEENRQLKGKEPGHSIMKSKRDSLTEEKQGPSVTKAPESRIEETQAPAVKQNPGAVVEAKKEQAARQVPEPLIEERQDLPAQQAQASAINRKKGARMASDPVAQPKKENRLLIQKKLEKQLNKVSDPRLSEKGRTAWKQEMMAQFSEEGVQIFDETTGSPRQYSTGIFLNLLSKVPHTILVKEVKTDKNRKVTELRLTMESNR